MSEYERHIRAVPVGELPDGVEPSENTEEFIGALALHASPPEMIDAAMGILGAACECLEQVTGDRLVGTAAFDNLLLKEMIGVRPAILHALAKNSIMAVAIQAPDVNDDEFRQNLCAEHIELSEKMQSPRGYAQMLADVFEASIPDTVIADFRKTVKEQIETAKLEAMFEAPDSEEALDNEIVPDEDVEVVTEDPGA